MDDVVCWLRLARVSSLHPPLLDPLLARFGSAAGLLAAGRRELRAAGVDDALATQLEAVAAEDLGPVLAWLAGENRHFIAWDDPRYPSLLRNLSDAPLGLFVAGDVEALASAQLAIVGSRNPTPQGRETARAFAAHLSRCGLTITSGLALGIDAAAHTGTLEAGGTTVAVCATGLDRVYPAAHAELAAAIARSGALVSEFRPGTPPLKEHFPRRNRLLSGLSLGTLVVEAALRSGSLITARLAGEQGREVFAIPGSIHSPLARGCHRLIREGARLVESADDILAELGPLAATLGPGRPTEAIDSHDFSSESLDKDYKILLDALGFEPTGIDLLVGRTGLKAGEVASMLLILELEGRVESYPGGLFIRTRSEAVQ